MSLNADKEFNPIDKIESKTELTIKLAVGTIATSVFLSVLDLGSVAIGLKDSPSLPNEFHATNGMLVTGFFGYLIGKKVSE